MQRFTNFTTHTVSWFKRALDNHELVMKPPFQRNPVWSERQKAYLIDTILNEYPIPEIYMQETVDERGSENFLVVDGQQRIRACLEYIEGNFGLNEEDSPNWPNIFFDDLSIEERKRIFEYSFIVRVLPEMPDIELRNIFKRINKNVVILNAQELRHATYWGPFIKLMEELADLDYWTTTSIFSANDIRRMLDIEFFSELTIAYLHGHQNKKQSLDKWYQIYEKDFSETQKVKSMFLKVTGELNQILPDLNKTRWNKKSDYYTLFLVFSNHENLLPLTTEKRILSKDILIQFGLQVTELLRDINRVSEFNIPVVVYSQNVERSAADIANRKKRFECLDEILGPVWS
jgi:hypothetical protein